MTIDVTVAKQLNALYNQSPELRQRRIEQVQTVCGPTMTNLLKSMFGESAARFGKPWAIIDAIHAGATLRSDCQSQTNDGQDCGVRATIQAVQDSNRQWILEDDRINFDRCQNHPCSECQKQCCPNPSQANRDNF